MEYRTSAGEVLLTGTVVIDTAPNSVSGIRCQCCGDVVSCSQFEAHAGEHASPAPRPHASSCQNVHAPSTCSSVHYACQFLPHVLCSAKDGVNVGHDACVSAIGRGARRAPYDSICNLEGKSLRRLAEQMPGGDEDVAEGISVGVGSIKELTAG